MRLPHLLSSLARLRPPFLGSPCLMHLAAAGELFCICAPMPAQRAETDRRGCCRGCGHSVASAQVKRYDQVLTRAEISQHVCSLYRAGRRSRRLELPTQVTGIVQLEAFLADGTLKIRRSRKRETAPSVSAQIH